MLQNRGSILFIKWLSNVICHYLHVTACKKYVKLYRRGPAAGVTGSLDAITVLSSSLYST